MAIFNSYVSLPEGMYFDKPENHESSSICHETGGSEMIEAIWAPDAKSRLPWNIEDQDHGRMLGFIGEK